MMLALALLACCRVLSPLSAQQPLPQRCAVQLAAHLHGLHPQPEQSAAHGVQGGVHLQARQASALPGS
jgi:hypothetical protein